jgi:hypothetical protein
LDWQQRQEQWHQQQQQCYFYAKCGDLGFGFLMGDLNTLYVYHLKSVFKACFAPGQYVATNVLIKKTAAAVMAAAAAAPLLLLLRMRV